MVVRCGDVQCAKQDVVSLSAIQVESYTWNTEIINHVREKTWSLSWYSGDQRRNAIMSENQTRCSGDDRVQSGIFFSVTGGDDYLYESKLWNHDRVHTQALDES